jgi:hypothetical protein
MPAEPIIPSCVALEAPSFAPKPFWKLLSLSGFRSYRCKAAVRIKDQSPRSDQGNPSLRCFRQIVVRPRRGFALRVNTQ